MPSAVARTRHANAPDNHHLDFLQFQKAKQLEKAAKPAPLSAEQHAANRECLSTVQFVQPNYSAETEINVSGILGRWKRYCNEMNVGDWRATIANLSRATTMDFFLFVCGNYKVRSWGSSGEYIRQFQQLYTTVTGRYMDRNDAKEVYKYHRTVLIPRFHLRAPNIDGKPVLNVDSLRVILTFNIAYDTSVFSLGRHRIQLTGCYQLLCYTGARPAELVDNERKGPKDGSREILFGQKVIQEADSDGSADRMLDKQSKELNKMLLRETIKRGRPKALCYEDILLMLVRHPATGKPVLAMAIKFIHHKGADNKPKPCVLPHIPPHYRLAGC
ncbi:hypothetical protein CRV24_000416 [Beauveria bassiana]|nr:hypothetical protein CRV24_000416 [Beauveria bassiana]